MRVGTTVSQPAPRHLMASLNTLAQRLDSRNTQSHAVHRVGRHALTGNE
jgi:hypothetical protein